MSSIDGHRDRWGVEPACRTLRVAPATYYARRQRPPSARALRDAELKAGIARVHEASFEAYGARKVWRQLRREGIAVGRDRVARLMGELGIRGVVRGSKRRTTTPAQADARPTWSSATSALASPTACGSPTSPTWPPGPGSPTWRSSSTRSPA